MHINVYEWSTSKCQENNKCNTREGEKTLNFFFTRKNQKQGEEGKAVKDEQKKSRIKSPKRNHEESFFLHIINAVGSH